MTVVEPRMNTGIGDVEHKRCCRCDTQKDIMQFDLNTKAKDGLYSWCKECRREWQRSRQPRKRQTEGEDTDEYPLSDLLQTTDSLYVMRNSMLTGMVKIGRSHSPEDRARDLAAAHPFEIIVCSSYGKWGGLEKKIHYKLKHRRVDGGRGREWFNVTPEQAAILISAVIMEHEIMASIEEDETD